MSPVRSRILVVDDKENMRHLLGAILADHHAVEAAADGNAALAMITRERYDLVLTDVRMPGADGFEVLRHVKAQSPGTEVIVMTAFASIGAAVEAIKAGAYDYIRKPFDPDDVVLVVARALESRERRPRAPDHPWGPTHDAPTTSADEDVAALSYRDAVNRARDQASRDYLSALLRACAGNVTQAALQAGLERESMHRLMKRYGVRADTFRSADDPDESM
jgi:DNA-binding NtrC family response regulator